MAKQVDPLIEVAKRRERMGIGTGKRIQLNIVADPILREFIKALAAGTGRSVSRLIEERMIYCFTDEEIAHFLPIAQSTIVSRFEGPADQLTPDDLDDDITEVEELLT